MPRASEVPAHRGRASPAIGPTMTTYQDVLLGSVTLTPTGNDNAHGPTAMYRPERLIQPPGRGGAGYPQACAGQYLFLQPAASLPSRP